MWQEPDSYPSEPIFVSHPDALEEDDGNAGGVGGIGIGTGKGCLCQMAPGWLQGCATAGQGRACKQLLDGMGQVLTLAVNF